MSATAAEAATAWKTHRGAVAARKDGYDVITCEACGFRHIVPIPDMRQIEHAYRQNYYRTEKPTYLLRATEDQHWAGLFQNDKLDAFEHHLNGQTRRLLDIGSGPGFFLRTAQQRGWVVKGIEPSEQAVEHSRGMGLDVVCGFFGAETAAYLGTFDVVHMNNVLEHIADPVAMLCAARDILNPGGVLCIGVPNDFSALQVAASSQSGEWWVAPPHHINYFDFTTLTRLIERLGMPILDRMTSFPMEAFLMMGDDYTTDPALGRRLHEKRKRFDLAFENAGLSEQRRAFYRALAAAGMGREAVVIARRA